MRKFIKCFKQSVVFLLIMFSTKLYAGSLPDALLTLPISLISGEQISLAEYKGEKPVYLKFWATWCQPCRKEMPHFEQIQKKYGESIKIIAINLGVNDDLNAVNDTIKEFGLTMPMAIDKKADLAQAFRMVGTPYHLLFDRNMNLIHRGHEANESLDNKLALVSQAKAVNLLDANLLVEKEPGITLAMDDDKTHALFFTATWCDWYLKDSRPDVSKNCIAAQKDVNLLYKQYPDIVWNGIVSRLWTGDKDLQDYKKKYAITHPVEIDRNNHFFYKYVVKDLPTLVLIKNNKVISKITNFSDREKITKLLRINM